MPPVVEHDDAAALRIVETVAITIAVPGEQPPQPAPICARSGRPREVASSRIRMRGSAAAARGEGHELALAGRQVPAALADSVS